MTLQKIAQKLISKARNNDKYKFKVELTNSQLLEIFRIRLFQFIRGKLLGFRFKRIGSLVFIGKYVRFEHTYNISIGKGVVIEDFVHLSGFGKKGILIGDNVTIAKFSSIICSGIIANMGEGVIIGNNSAIGAQSFIAGQGGITIGTDVIMGPNVKIFSENHEYSHPFLPIRLQGEKRKGVKIGNNCWIGSGTTILDGVEIGDGSVIAAGSVVTKSIQNNSLVSGIPAKIIRNRISS